jgi:hypothetical protein
VEFVDIPQHETEEQVGGNGGVFDLDLAAVSKLLKQACDGSDPAQPTLFMGQFCQFRKLDSLRRKGSPQHHRLRLPGAGEQVPAKIVQRRL